jgi:hypothetical protein
MRHARGYSIINDPRFSRPFEIDTFTCLHCQQVVDKPPFKSATDDDIGAWCHCCNGPICHRCRGLGCRPIEHYLERLESRRYIRECL